MVPQAIPSLRVWQRNLMGCLIDFLFLFSFSELFLDRQHVGMCRSLVILKMYIRYSPTSWMEHASSPPYFSESLSILSFNFYTQRLTLFVSQDEFKTFKYLCNTDIHLDAYTNGCIQMITLNGLTCCPCWVLPSSSPCFIFTLPFFIFYFRVDDQS